MTMIITIGVAAEAVRLSVASEEVEVSEEAEVLAAAASEEEWAEESPRKKMDPFAIADAADFSGDWEDIDCKG